MGEGGREEEREREGERAHFVNSKDHYGASLEPQLSLKTLLLYKNVF